MWITLVFGGAAVLYFALTVATLWHLRWVGRLPAWGEVPAVATPIRCSVIIAARDEESRIEQTIDHLLVQRGVELEIIVVDDRSQDRTREILQRRSREDARLRTMRVDVLPEGWLGKCHACHVGAAAATGDWILFTDADCWLKPDVIARAVGAAVRDGADHVTAVAGPLLTAPAPRAWYLLFLTTLLGWFSGVNRDRPKAFVGLGAFNLVRAAAYRQCGGYEALRLTVLDDVRLGLLLRRAGKRTRAFFGADDVECHWGATVGSLVRIVEKNYFAALDYRLEVVVVGGTLALLLFLIPVVGLFSGTVVGGIAAFSPLSLIVPAAIIARRIGWSWPAAALMPFMLPTLLYAAVNSTWVTLRQGGIRWRETFYPLATLRAGNVK